MLCIILYLLLFDKKTFKWYNIYYFNELFFMSTNKLNITKINSDLSYIKLDAKTLTNMLLNTMF